MTTAARTAGVLGGMGPRATLDFLDKVQRASGAARDQDHIRLLVDLNPAVPDRNVALASGDPAVGAVLGAMAAGLERAGADFLVMVCNTAHAFRPAIEAGSRLPFVSMIDETVAEIAGRDPAPGCVGLLATGACLASGLYQAGFKRAGIATVGLSGAELDRFMALLYRIKAGDTGSDVANGAGALAAQLARRGAQLLIAACTEWPLVLSSQNSPLALVDATEVLARRTVAYARGAALPPTAA
jgi:aspartate racemase